MKRPNQVYLTLVSASPVDSNGEVDWNTKIELQGVWDLDEIVSDNYGTVTYVTRGSASYAIAEDHTGTINNWSV